MAALTIVSLLLLVVSVMAQGPRPSYGHPQPGADGNKAPSYPSSPPGDGKAGYDNRLPYGPKAIPDINEAIKFARSFVGQFYNGVENLVGFNTLAAIASESLSGVGLINSRELPIIRLDNDQLDADITRAYEEITELWKRVAAAKVSATAGLASANATRDVIVGQRALLIQVAKNNAEQARLIQEFQQEIRNFEAYFLQDLEKQLAHLNGQLAKERQNANTVSTFVDNQKCESGVFIISLDHDTVDVKFTSNFTKAPIVDVVGTGSTIDINPPANSYPPSDLDYSPDKKSPANGYGQSDKRDSKLVLSNITTKGFTARLLGASSGNVLRGTFFYRFLACQNLDIPLRL